MNEDNILTDKNFKFLPYNTGNEPLPMPEYGRSIQQMVDYCVMIEDKEKRTACAYSIISVMKRLFPKMVDKKDDSKFWDHLNIMARFELDIDFPCEVVSAEEIHRKPNPIPYTNQNIRFRHYGRNVQDMIGIVADMENGEEKDELIEMLANHLKKLLLINNPEGVEDARVFDDVYMYSEGKINLVPGEYKLHEYKAPELAQNKKKKRK